MPGRVQRADATSVRAQVSVVVVTITVLLTLPPTVHGQACTVQNCRPPNCFCKGGDIPGGLPLTSTPQLVMVTFDDAVNQAHFPLYRSLFNNKVNPGGCPAKGTFYVCHDYSNYQMIQTLYNEGHEIASHSISHRLPSGWWSWASPAEWNAEIEGQRQILSTWAGIPKSEIRGMRAPYLSVGGDAQFQMISSLLADNFVYDSSVVSRVHRQSAFISPTWPYTMDYPPSDECLIPPCPSQSYPGVWEIPLVSTQTSDGQWCSMEDECTPNMSENEVYSYFLDNLNRHYTSNRAPFGIFLHGPFLENPGHFRALDRFMSDVSRRGDVFFVTAWQVIQWMRNPLPLSQMANFFCSIRQNVAPCTQEQANFCLFDGGASLVNRKKRSSVSELASQTLDDQVNGNQTTGNQTVGNPNNGNQTTGNATFGSQIFVNGSVGNQTTGNQTTGNQTTGNQTTGNQTTGNQTTGNQTTGNQTTGNQTTGNQTTGNQTVAGLMFDNLVLGELYLENQIAGNQTGGNQTVGNQTVGNQTSNLEMDNLEFENQVAGTGNQTVGNQTVGNQTVGNQTSNLEMDNLEFENQVAGTGNQTIGNQTVGNQTVGNQTSNLEMDNLEFENQVAGTGNQTTGNQTVGNQTAGNLTSDDVGLRFAEFRAEKFQLRHLGSARFNSQRRTGALRRHSFRQKRQAYNGWHNMYTCNPCPQSYPWIGNSEGL